MEMIKEMGGVKNIIIFARVYNISKKFLIKEWILMYKFNKIFLLILIALIIPIFMACGSKEVSSANEEPVILRLGTLASSDGSAFVIAAENLAKDIEKETGGKVKIQVFPDSQLGAEIPMAEQVQVGTLDMALISAPTLANFVKELNIIEIPFLFRDNDHIYKVLDGEIGDDLSNITKKSGFKNLGFWEVGFKNISNSKKEIFQASDLKNLSIRVNETDIAIDTYNTLGAKPTPISYPEVYTSLQQGVVDGFEGAYTPYENINLYEVQPYISEVRIAFHTSLLVMNSDRFESFDQETQKIIENLAKKHTIEQRKINKEIESNYIEEILAYGVMITKFEDIDIDSFREASKPLYEKYGKSYGDLIQRIIDTN